MNILAVLLLDVPVLTHTLTVICRHQSGNPRKPCLVIACSRSFTWKASCRARGWRRATPAGDSALVSACLQQLVACVQHPALKVASLHEEYEEPVRASAGCPKPDGLWTLRSEPVTMQRKQRCPVGSGTCKVSPHINSRPHTHHSNAACRQPAHRLASIQNQNKVRCKG